MILKRNFYIYFVVPEWRDDNRPRESKVWPPPKAPDYVQSTRTLPAGFKVVSEEGEGSRDGERKGGSGQYSRQDGEESMCVVCVLFDLGSKINRILHHIEGGMRESHPSVQDFMILLLL